MALECGSVTGLGEEVCLLVRRGNGQDKESLVGDLISEVMVDHVDVPCAWA